MKAIQLKAARAGLGITQYKMAEYLGVRRSAYAHWEQGNARVPAEIWAAVTDAGRHAKKMQECLAVGGQHYRKWRGW